MLAGAEVVPYRPWHQPEVAEVVRAVYDEYGFAWEPDGYCSDLLDPGARYSRFWVALDEGRVVGCAGLQFHPVVPGVQGTCTVFEGRARAGGTDSELVRLYLLPSHRGQGLGRRLAVQVLDAARAEGRTALEIWSDKKLAQAHALYSKLGAVPIGERICPGDPDESPEWGFVLALR